MVSLVCLAGCNSVGSFADRVSAQFVPGRSDSKVTAKQNADIHVALGRSLEKQNNVDRAMAAYSKAVELDPKRADAYWRLAVLHDKNGAFSESAKFYSKAIRADSRNPDIYADVGYSLYLQGHPREAEKKLRQAVDLEAGHRRAHNNLGLVLARTGRVKEALAEFGRAGCSEADSYANVGFALTMQHRWDEARRHYELALAADPKSNAARIGLRDLNAVVAAVSPDRTDSLTVSSPAKQASAAPEAAPAAETGAEARVSQAFPPADRPSQTEETVPESRQAGKPVPRKAGIAAFRPGHDTTIPSTAPADPFLGQTSS
jgi:Tfp pilus assembly protein PilF